MFRRVALKADRNFVPSDSRQYTKKAWAKEQKMRFRNKVRLAIFFLLVLYLLPHPAFAQGGPINAIVDSAQGISDAISESVDSIWEDNLALFMVIPSAAAALFAVFSTLVMGFELLDEHRQYGTTDWSRLVWPLIASTLLGSIVLAASVPLAIRNSINELNNGVLEQVGIIEQLSEASAASNFPSEIAPLLDECLNRQIERQTECIREATQQAQEVLDNNQARFGNTTWIDFWRNKINGIGDRIVDNPENLLTLPELYSDIQLAIASPILEGGLIAILTAVQGAFQIMVEGALLITAFIFPFAVALSIKDHSDPLKEWAFKMYQVGAVKFFYSLLIGISSIIYIGAGGVGNSMWFPVYTAVLAPFLAFSAVSGGGLAIWQTVISAVGSAASLGLRLKRKF